MKSLLPVAAATVLLLLVGTCGLGAQAMYNPGTNVTAAARSSLFDKVLRDLVPILEEIGPEIELGPLSSDHYSVGKFHLNNLKISSIDMSFVAPNKIALNINGLDVSFPHTDFSVFTHIFDQKEREKLLLEEAEAEAKGLAIPNPVEKVSPTDFKISCSGQAWGGVTGASAAMTIALSTNAAGQLIGTAESASLNVGGLSIDYHMNSFLCKVGGAIIHLFLDVFKKLIEHEIDRLLPGKLQTVIQNLLDKELPKLPVKFVTQPNVVAETMEIDVEVIPPHSYTVMRSGEQKKALMDASSPASGSLAVQPHVWTTRDVSFGISTPSFNDLIEDLAAAKGFSFNKVFHGDLNTSIFKVLIPPAYEKCPNCPFGVYFDIQKNSPPVGIFGGEAMQFKFKNALVNFTAENANQEEDLFSVIADLDFELANFSVTNDGDVATIKFDLDLIAFNLTLGYSFLGPIDMSKFAAWASNFLKTVVDPLFNSHFTGIPLKLEKDGYGLDDWLIDLNQDAISLGANLVLPPSSLGKTNQKQKSAGSSARIDSSKAKQAIVKSVLRNGLKL